MNLIEKWEKEAEFTSTNLKTAMENLHTFTGGGKEFQSLEKARFAITFGDLLEKSDEIKKYFSLYGGSGYDIEFPLSLHLRKIDMVGECMGQSVIEEIKKRISRFDSSYYVQDLENGNKLIGIEFDFGKGKEKVTIRLIKSRLEDFSPQDYYGMLMTYSPHLTYADNPEILDKLVNKAYILFGGMSGYVDKNYGLITIKNLKDKDIVLYQKVSDSEELIEIAKKNREKRIKRDKEILTQQTTEERINLDDLEIPNT